MPGRDWLQMTPADFDTDLDPQGSLFDLPLRAVSPIDGCETGDLLAEIPADDTP